MTSATSIGGSFAVLDLDAPGDESPSSFCQMYRSKSERVVGQASHWRDTYGRPAGATSEAQGVVAARQVHEVGVVVAGRVAGGVLVPVGGLAELPAAAT